MEEHNIHTCLSIHDMPHIPCHFSDNDISLITNHFSNSNLIATGHRWKLYQGILANHQVVTVKRWDNPETEDSISSFNAELRLLTCPLASSHPNIAKLFGYCRSQLGLVYDLASMDTLHANLSSGTFTWLLRLKVALDIARTLAFLHRQDPPCVLRNLEPAHIMLDGKFNAVLFDFGLATGGLFGDRTGSYQHLLSSEHYKNFHLHPSGLVSTARDVFDFGSILLALLVMRTVVDDKSGHVVELVNSIGENRRYIGHPDLMGDGHDFNDEYSVADLAWRCTEGVPEERPSMVQVVACLKGLHALKKSSWYARGMRHKIGYTYLEHPNCVSSRDLEVLTDNFSEENLLDQVNFLGNESHSKVYRGTMKQCQNCPTDKEVTVKIWDQPKFDLQYFEDEMMFLTLDCMTSHPNLVKLIGYCRENGMLGLVYDIASQSTLRNKLYDARFSWAQRIKVAHGLANALAHLHAQSPSFILCNLDPANIMLDKDFNPRLFDFGLGTGGILRDRVSHYPRYFGSPGFIDPTYFGERGSISCDVYAFGVVLLALISARFVVDPATPGSHIVLWAAKKKSSTIACKGFRGTLGYDSKDASKMVKLARRCVSLVPEKRPKMEEVASILEGLTIAPMLI